MRETGANVEPCLTELASQDELVVAVLAGEVVGAYAWRRARAEDLANLPEEVAVALPREHPDLLTAGHLCVAPAHRRKGVPDALVATSLERLAEGPETAIVVRTRDSRRVDALARRHGAVKVGETLAYGETSSVFVFTRTL